jgi:phage terminase small subunit
MRDLNARQRKFAEIYDGNGIQSARAAGYTGNDNVLGVTAHDLLRNPRIMAIVKARQEKEKNPLIASRQQRQEFWTKVMNMASVDMNDRLKASELLGKSEADFTENVKNTHVMPEPLNFVPAKPKHNASGRG